MLLDILGPVTGSYRDRFDPWKPHCALHGIVDVMDHKELYQMAMQFFSNSQFIQFLRDIDVPVLLQIHEDWIGCEFPTQIIGFQSAQDKEKFRMLADGLTPQYHLFRAKTWEFGSVWRNEIYNWVKTQIADGVFVSSPINANVCWKRCLGREPFVGIETSTYIYDPSARWVYWRSPRFRTVEDAVLYRLASGK